MQIFARMTKVDEASRTVSGLIASEAVDRSGEVFDYESSKPLFEAWSGGIAKATEGKSVGNVRAMHGNIAAGTLKALHMDDAAKAITVDAHIVDDNEWRKVQSGTYTGFSIGGKYARKWTDGDVQRYTAEPYEVSLVDLPCNPDAQFTVIKADGAQELRKFAKVAERKDVNPKEGEHKYGDVTFADEKNKKYPINTPAHIRAAWNYINKPKNAAKYDAKDLKTIKSKIIAAWKDKIDKNGPPSAEAKKCDAQADCRAAGLFVKIDQAEPLLRTVRSAYGMEPLAKDLWNVGQLADLVSNLNCITLCAENEANWEGDNSAVPGELRGVVKELAGILIDMADEEVEELVSAYEKADLDGDLAKAAQHEGVADMADEALQKSLSDTKAELAKTAETVTKHAADLAAANESLAKVTGERDALQKGIAERDEALLKAAAHIEAQAALIEEFKKQPMPLKVALTAIAKGDDVTQPDAAKDEKVLKGDGSVDEVATALRKALRNPVVTR